MFLVGGNANFSIFRYQHVGIPNTKFVAMESKPMPGPNANGFASQWNIGFTCSSKVTLPSNRKSLVKATFPSSLQNLMALFVNLSVP